MLLVVTHGTVHVYSIVKNILISSPSLHPLPSVSLVIKLSHHWQTSIDFLRYGTYLHLYNYTPSFYNAIIHLKVILHITNIHLRNQMTGKHLTLMGFIDCEKQEIYKHKQLQTSSRCIGPTQILETSTQPPPTPGFNR